MFAEDDFIQISALEHRRKLPSAKIDPGSRYPELVSGPKQA
jgi:hypothetical protein